MTKWNHFKEDQTHGPFTAEELKELVANGQLRRQDRALNEGNDLAPASCHNAALNFPDWLEDIAKLETKGPLQPPKAGHEIPDWLEDLRIWYGLETPPAPPVVPPTPLTPVTQSVASAPQTTLPDQAIAGGADALAEKAIRETGFDSRTGQILDPEQFQKWKHSNAPSAAPAGRPTNVALLEAFHKARNVLSGWLDDDAHRELVLRGDLDDIEDSAGVTAILDKYAGYGPVLREKLVKHLAFLVENRRKYDAATRGPRP